MACESRKVDEMNQRDALLIALENASGMIIRESWTPTGITTHEGEVDALTREEIAKVSKEMLKLGRSLERRLAMLKYKNNHAVNPKK